MIHDVIFRPEARLDIIDIRKWYNGNKRGLGKEFLLSFSESIFKIQENPKLYPLVYKNIRKCITHKFPYSIFYLIENEEIIILACMHFKRHPKNWQKRNTS